MNIFFFLCLDIVHQRYLYQARDDVCCENLNCTIPARFYYPDYEKSLEGLAWHRVLHTLISLKKSEKYKEFQFYMKFVDRYKKHTDLKLTVNCRGVFYSTICVLCQKRECDEPCYRYTKKVACTDYLVYRDVSVTDLVRVIIKAVIDYMHFGISNSDVRAYRTADRRCPIHYDVKRIKYRCVLYSSHRARLF